MTGGGPDGEPGGSEPTIDKEKLIAKILETINAAKKFLADKGFELQKMIDASGFEKMAYLVEAADAVSGSLEDRKTFTTCASELERLVKYADRDDLTKASRKEYEAIAAIHGQLRKKRSHADTTGLMVQINDIISSYVKIEEPREIREEPKKWDISAINFDLLQKEFARVKSCARLFTTLHPPFTRKSKRLRVYTIVVFSFIRTFAPSF